MTSKLKCPVCGKTELIRMFNPLTGKYFEDYDCPFRLCNFRGNKVAVDALIQSQKDLENAKADIEDYKKYKALWEQIRNNTIIELERKLEIARKALEKYADEDMWVTCNVWEVDYIQGMFLEYGYKIAKEALEQINSKQD